MPCPFVDPGSILVVEDDHDLNRLFCKYLRNAGYTVNGVHSLCDALLTLDHSAPPEIIVLDLSLNDGHGKVILDLLRERGLAQTRVVVVSGWAHERDYRLDGYAVEHILLKPVMPRDLAKLVRTLHGAAPLH